MCVCVLIVVCGAGAVYDGDENRATAVYSGRAAGKNFQTFSLVYAAHKFSDDRDNRGSWIAPPPIFNFIDRQPVVVDVVMGTRQGVYILFYRPPGFLIDFFFR